MPRHIRWSAAILAAVITALALAWALFVPGADWFATHDVGHLTGQLRAEHLQTARDAARGRLLTLSAGLLAITALIYTARTYGLSRESQVTDRYTKAIEQLGSDKLDIRIGGIYALERIARDSAKDHPTVMEVLTAFTREHSREPWSPPASRQENTEPPQPTTRPDVQAAITVIGRRKARQDRDPISLTGARLAGAVLYGANLAEAHLADSDLSDANLVDATLAYAFLHSVNFTKANLRWAKLANALLIRADLTDARLPGAKLTGAYMPNAILTRADLTDARLTRADLTDADLTDADLTNANLSGAKLIRANLTGTDLTGTDLHGADLSRALLPANAPVPEGWTRGQTNQLHRSRPFSPTESTEVPHP